MRRFALFFCFLVWSFGPVSAQPAEPVSFQIFYDNLSTYGDWITDPVHKFVWVPKVGAGFRPYFTNGHWVMTEFGTTWISDYPWGWAPFHYGRWIHDSFYGWVWVPGTEWGPAWVVWRSSSDHYGWVPLTPGVSVSASFGPSYYSPADWWIFVPHHSLLDPQLAKHYKGPGQNINILKNTSVIKSTNTHDGFNSVSGPRASEFARATNQRVTTYTIKSAGTPTKVVKSETEVALFKPVIVKEYTGKEPTPIKFKTGDHAIGKASPVAAGPSKSQPSTAAKKAPAKSSKKPAAKKPAVKKPAAKK